jgi:xanthine dehydrogenase accessory factor
MNIFAEAGKLNEQGVTFAIATIIASKGSTPRNTAKMIVKNEGSILGTIGGGLAEAYIIKEALAAIEENQSRVVEYILNSDAAGGIQMSCGGKLTVFIEVILNKPKIMMIGAGHVGFAISKLVEFLDYKLSIIDDRQEFANADKYPQATEIYCDPHIEKAIEQVHIDNNTYIIIATKDSDLSSLKKVIHSNAAYLGMIGSKRKVAIAMEQLKVEGISDERIQLIHAPVGLDIGSETPEEIAVSILAEILMVKNNRTGLSLKELNKH